MVVRMSDGIFEVLLFSTQEICVIVLPALCDCVACGSRPHAATISLAKSVWFYTTSMKGGCAYRTVW